MTLGGVDTRGLSSKTMGRRVPGLYFIGEVVDVTGWLGGYNFQWAWASGARRRRRRSATFRDEDIVSGIIVLRRSVADATACSFADGGPTMLRPLKLSVAMIAALACPRAQVRIGLMVSSTGPTTAIGIPQKNTGDLLPRKIGNATVEYFQLDDGGDTTRAVQNARS